MSPYESAYGFSRALRVGDTIYVAGTAPVPESGENLAEGAYDQMLRCGRIAQDAIESLGGSMADVVRTRTFIVDVGDADDIGRAHKELFGGSEPAATMVVISALLDPRWRVEIEVDAVIG